MQQTPEGLWFLEEIDKRGYAEFQHEIPNEQIETLVSAYANFTVNQPVPSPATMDSMLPSTPTEAEKTNPRYLNTTNGTFVMGKWLANQLDELDRSKDDQRQWHKYRTNTSGFGKPDGYTNRSYQQRALKQARGIRLDPTEDPKEFYHFSTNHLSCVKQNHLDYKWGNIPAEVIKLSDAFLPIHQKASKLILKVAALIEETHPEIRGFFNASSLSESPVRLLFYHPSTTRHFGAGHYDKSALTIQIAESHEGLSVAPDDQTPLAPIVRTKDMAVVFPGHNLRETVGKGTPFQPGWHDIIKVNRLNQGRNVPPKAIEICARWALIFFANGKNFVAPDKTIMHTR